MAAQGGWDTLIVDYGTYTVGVEAVCTHTSSSMGGYEHVKLDTNTVLTIPTIYVKPSASSLYVTANTEEGFGRHPSLPCKNTGRVQLKIENGKFPYYITVVKHGTTDTLQIDTITAPQYTGTSELRYDYKDYYTFDEMPPGDWDFYLVDGCDYGLPRMGQVVEVEDYPLLDHVEVYASSGNMADSNVVKIKAVLDKDYSFLPDSLSKYVEYRFTYDGNPSSDWKPLTATLDGEQALLTDTVGDKYCDIWDKEIQLQYRRKVCEDTTVTRSFHLYKPNENYFVRDFSDIRDSLENVDHTCDDLHWWHRRYHEIYYKYNAPSQVTIHEDHTYYRHHYTHPLTWVYYDTELGDTIKKDVVNSISSISRLYDTDVEAKYGDFSSYTAANPLNIPVQRTLVDARGCVVYSRFDSLSYCYDHGPQLVDWKIFNTIGDHCCTTQGAVGVYENHHSEVDPDGTTIILEESPYNNRYNFTAVYSSASNRWTVSRENLENFASITGSNGLSIVLRDYCLPSGPYQFRVMTPCDTFVLRDNIAFPNIYSTEMVEVPVFAQSQHCTDRYITYTQGQFARVSRNTSVTTGLPLADEILNLPTYFEIIGGPTGGYDGDLHTVNDPIRISMPGDYVVKVAPRTSQQLCDLTPYYDTIHYDGATVEFEYAYAFLCDSTSLEGTVYVKGVNGTPPYIYTLFDEAEKQGNVVETITMSDTTQPAIFSNKTMNAKHEMSCLIEDACGAYFHVNFYPRTLADVQKLWFDGGLTASETCEGSTIQVHALEIASILKYEWYNPQNQLVDSISSPNIFIPRGAEDGWYKVVIRNSGCQDSIVDSVKLTVKEAPTISIHQNAEICPGEVVNLSFVPTSPSGDSITVTIAFENADGIETRTYYTASGVALDEEYITLTDAKIYPLSLSDGNCDYTLADEYDTTYITTKKDIANACNLLGSNDTVCYGGGVSFAAHSTMEKPYTIRWYSDYELTHLLKEETMTATGADISYYDTLGLTHHTEVFVSIEKEGYCPTVYGLPTNTVNLSNGNTELPCGRVLRVYDDGGANGDYSVGANTRHTYITADGKPVSIHFEELDLSETAHLLVITGTALSVDSVLYDLTAGSPNPGIITSHGNALTLYFIPGMKPASGWNAIVEHVPGMAVAEVWKRNDVMIQDEVCQSQTNPYDDPFGVVPDVVPELSLLNRNMRKAGTYTYTQTLPGADAHGCDSTVTFILTVHPPARHDTTVVTTNLILSEQGPFVWPADGRSYTVSGRYSKHTAKSDGCDSLDIMDFIVLQVDTTDNEICKDETTRLGVTVTVPELNFSDDIIPPTVAIGDVLCDDGSVIKVDSFLKSDKIAKGVVFYVDNSDMHGKAVALNNATPTTCSWSPVETSDQVHSLRSCTNATEAIQDFDGLSNTLEIKYTAEQISIFDFQQNAPAAYYCYYYDHISLSTGNVPLGWYLPSAGELNLLYANKENVNATLKKLHDTNAAASTLWQYYWSSTEQNPSRAWNVQNEGALSVANESEMLYVRSIISF